MDADQAGASLADLRRWPRRFRSSTTGRGCWLRPMSLGLVRLTEATSGTTLLWDTPDQGPDRQAYRPAGVWGLAGGHRQRDAIPVRRDPRRRNRAVAFPERGLLTARRIRARGGLGKWPCRGTVPAKPLGKPQGSGIPEPRGFGGGRLVYALHPACRGAAGGHRESAIVGGPRRPAAARRFMGPGSARRWRGPSPRTRKPTDGLFLRQGSEEWVAASSPRRGAGTGAGRGDADGERHLHESTTPGSRRVHLATRDDARPVLIRRGGARHGRLNLNSDKGAPAQGVRRQGNRGLPTYLK